MLSEDLTQKIETELEKLSQLTQKTLDPDLVKNQNEYRKVLQEYSQINELQQSYQNLLRINHELEEAEKLQDSSDNEMREMVAEEIKSLTSEAKQVEGKILKLLVPINPLDNKGILMEIRAGTGGEEAALFAADLFRMYARYAEIKKWKLEIIDSNLTELGGYKEVIFSIPNPCFGILKNESGVHRVQRIPNTESGGRIHTSAVTVAVLPEAEETEVVIKPEDIRIDIFRSSGPGGQSVNTTDSAVRIIHLPTKITVSCQDEKSQHKNKEKAMRVLRARITAFEEEKRQFEIAAQRKEHVGTGDRSERIRTYNYPQNRITDHRINLTLYQLDRMMEGEIEELLDTLMTNL